jgi:phage tail sheath protein FI
MSIKRGVVTEVTSNSARPISVSSTLPIALVLQSSVIASDVYGFDSPQKALDFFDDNDKLKDDTGNLKKYLKVGIDKFGLIVPIIVSISSVDADNDRNIANMVDAVNALKTAPSITEFKPDIVAVGFDEYNLSVYNAVDDVCKVLKARTFLDLYAPDNGQAISRRNNFGSDRITVAKCSVKILNTTTANLETYDSGIMLAWLRCSVDGSGKLGYSKSISNRLLSINGVVSPSEFYAGCLDSTDPLTEKQIMSFIHYKGFRTWEYATTSADAIWQDARRVRIFDMCAAAVIDGIFFAVDKDMNALNAAKDSLRGFMNGLVGDDVMVGFNVELDLARTTKERVTAGEFYFIVDAQEMPSAKLIHVTFNKVDRYASTVYKMIDQ